jgi:hypothetical protein
MRSRALTVFVLLLLFIAFFPEQAGQAAQSIVAALLNALLVLAIWQWLADPFGRLPGLLVLAAVVCGLLTIPEVDAGASPWRIGPGCGARWATACRYTGLATASDRIPRIMQHGLVPTGDRLVVRLPPGSSTAALAEAAEQVAVILDVREVRVARDPDRASLARVTVVRRDPLHGAPPLA